MTALATHENDLNSLKHNITHLAPANNVREILLNCSVDYLNFNS